MELYARPSRSTMILCLSTCQYVLHIDCACQRSPEQGSFLRKLLRAKPTDKGMFPARNAASRGWPDV